MNNRQPNAMHPASGKEAGKQVLHGVNETIANALSTVLARPGLMLVPLALDLVLWLGWQFSAVPLTNWLGREMERNGGNDGPTVAEEVLEFGERARVNDLLAAGIPSVFGGLPKDSILNLLVATFAPALTRGVDRANMYREWEDGLLSTITAANGFGVFTLGVLFLFASTVFAVLFRVPQARLLRGEALQGLPIVQDLIQSWWRLLLLVALLFGIGIVVLLPVTLVLAVLYLAGINLVALLILGLFGLGGLVALYTFFAIDAIVLNRAGPLQAISLSMAVVRENLGMSFRFVVVSVLIGTGILRVWDVLIENPPGIVIALLANAFLGTGLSLASMQFYQERYRRLDPNVARRALSAGRRWFR